jgi:SAM-dependent methyltransferase
MGTPPRAEIQWQRTACPLCGGPRHTPLIEAPDPTADAGPRFSVVRCSDCGLCFTNPRPDPESIRQFYPNTYRPHQTAARSQRQPSDRPGWRRRQSRRYGRLRSDGPGRLLDVGCGAGQFLQLMRQAGWEVTGLDLSAEVVARVRDEMGLRALAGSLPHPELPPESFDLVTMWQSLEHFHQPLEMLQEAHALLAPGGRLLAAVPNLDSGSFRLFGPSWFGLDLPRHLVHFTPLTLRAMLERAGFVVEEVRQIRRASWLRASARLARSRRQRRGWLDWLALGPPGRLAALYFHLRGRSDTILATAIKASCCPPPPRPRRESPAADAPAPTVPASGDTRGGESAPG